VLLIGWEKRLVFFFKERESKIKNRHQAKFDDGLKGNQC
jgi:hypothetical protein